MTLTKLKLIKNIPIVLILALSCMVLFKGCSSRSTKTKNTLVVGMMSGWPPYMSINKQGNFEGFDVEIACQLGKQLNKRIEIRDLGSVESLMMALERKTIDMVFSGLDITQKRLEKFAMVPYTGEGITCFYLLFWKQVPAGVTTVEDFAKLENNTTCVEPATPSDQFMLQSKFNSITKKSISKVSDMILELKYGRSSAAILEPIAAEQVLRKTPEITYIKIPLPKQFQIFGVGIALRKDNQKLQIQAQQAIDTMKKKGIITRLEQKWNMPGVQS